MNPRLLSLLVLLAAPAAAQPDAHAIVERGRALVAAGHFGSSPDSLLAARATLGLAAESDDHEAAAWAAYYSALADYRLAYTFYQDADRALRHAESGAEALDGLVDDRALGDDLRAEAAALRAGLLGLQMGLDPARAASLGPASQTATRTSLDLAPDNPRVLFLHATGLLNTPEEWGGDRATAVRQLEKALDGFSAPASGLAPTWGEDEAYAWLGLAYLMAGEAGPARAAIERATELNPSSPFVQYKLMPWLESVEAAP
jgi:tetratricopeptide (TPR) repeat protein